MSVVRHMFYGSWDIEFDAAFIFGFEPRKGQGQANNANFKMENVVPKTCLSCLVLSQDSKKCHLFSRTTIRDAEKNHSKSVTLSHLHFYHCTGKNDIALICCVFLVVQGS